MQWLVFLWLKNCFLRVLLYSLWSSSSRLAFEGDTTTSAKSELNSTNFLSILLCLALYFVKLVRFPSYDEPVRSLLSYNAVFLFRSKYTYYSGAGFLKLRTSMLGNEASCALLVLLRDFSLLNNMSLTSGLACLSLYALIAAIVFLDVFFGFWSRSPMLICLIFIS